MALVRILIDGYNLIHAWERYRNLGDYQTSSLLHNWPQLAPGRPRHSEEARDELIQRLTLYRDAIGTPITIVFDGSRPKSGPVPEKPDPNLEVIYSRSGQTADDIIERVAVRMQPYGEVLVITDDFAERDTVLYHGGMASSCYSFIEEVEAALREQERDIARHNRTERRRFKNSR